jgi:predicted RNase H-like HicB family nuclease
MYKADEGGYWGEVIELPGCVSQGETEEEFRENIREAIETMIDLETQEPNMELYAGEASEEPSDYVLFIDSSSDTWTAAI